MSNTMISPWSLVISFALVLIAMAISQKEKLGLTKEIFWSIFRMIVQLVIVGYLLTSIFEVDSFWVTLASIIIMVANAAWNASRRANGLPNAFKYSLIALFLSVSITLSILVLSGAIAFVPSQVIPINGMIIGNGMNVVGLSFRNLENQFYSNRQEIQEKLALGANKKQASKPIITEAIKGSLQPTVDTTKTVGIVTLPGMMTGLIIAGIDPMDAIMYQILVFFMLISASSIASVVGVYLSYQEYFTNYGQLIVRARQD